MYDRSYQQRRGELQALGEILHAALKVADPNYYRPERPFQHARKAKKRSKDDGKLRGVQLNLFAPSNAGLSGGSGECLFLSSGEASGISAKPSHSLDQSAITPENPITDADVPF